MTTAHWLYLMAIAIWTALLLCFSLAGQGNHPLYKWIQRVFWAAAALQLSSELDLIGLNAVNLLISTCLGTPGYLALCAVSFF